MVKKETNPPIRNALDVVAEHWTMMACVDRLVEIGEIREVIQFSRLYPRIFTASSERESNA